MDTCAIIDAVKYKYTKAIEEERKANAWHTEKIIEAAMNGDVELVTSTLTIAECRRAEQEKAATQDVKDLINEVLSSGRVIRLAFVNQSFAEYARDLEWVYGINLKGADSIHVATAILLKCQEIFTGDDRIYKNRDSLKARGLRVVRPKETLLLPPEYKAGVLFDGAPKPKAKPSSRVKRSTPP